MGVVLAVLAGWTGVGGTRSAQTPPLPEATAVIAPEATAALTPTPQPHLYIADMNAPVNDTSMRLSRLWQDSIFRFLVAVGVMLAGIVVLINRVMGQNTAHTGQRNIHAAAIMATEREVTAPASDEVTAPEPGTPANSE